MNDVVAWFVANAYLFPAISFILTGRPRWVLGLPVASSHNRDGDDT